MLQVAEPGHGLAQPAAGQRRARHPAHCVRGLVQQPQPDQVQVAGLRRQAVEDAAEGLLGQPLGGGMIGHERMDQHIEIVEGCVEDLRQRVPLERAEAVYQPR